MKNQSSPLGSFSTSIHTKGRRLKKCDKTKLRTVFFFLHAWETRDMTNKKYLNDIFQSNYTEQKFGVWLTCVVIYAPLMEHMVYFSCDPLFIQRQPSGLRETIFSETISNPSENELVLQGMNLIQCCYMFFMSSRKENVIFLSLTKTFLSNLLFLPVHLIEALN